MSLLAEVPKSCEILELRAFQSNFRVVSIHWECCLAFEMLGVLIVPCLRWLGHVLNDRTNIVEMLVSLIWAWRELLRTFLRI